MPDINRMNLYGDWERQLAADPAAEASEAGKAFVAWMGGADVAVTREMLEIAKQIILSQERYQNRLHDELRKASAEFNAMGSGEVETLGLPGNVGELALRHRSEERYMVAKHAAQRILDIINEAIEQS